MSSSSGDPDHGSPSTQTAGEPPAPATGGSVAVVPERESSVKRRHISQAQRRLIWEYLNEKYGHLCYAEGCGRADVQIDSKDGDKNNKALNNLQPACPVHQKVRTVSRNPERELARERPRAGGREAPVSVNADSRPTESYEIRAHAAEPVFRSWVIGKLVFNHGGPLPSNWFIVNGAEVFKVMQVTTERWMDKLACESGPLESDELAVGKRMTKVVRLKSAFWATAARRELEVPAIQ